jgi:hypothetical protein
LSGFFFYIGSRYVGDQLGEDRLNLNILKISRIILFSDGLKRLLKQINVMLRIAWRMLLSILKGFRGLRVDSLLVNDVFLLSNGLIQVRWKVRYAWTMRINGKRLDPVIGHYTLYPTGEEMVLSIHIRGLFRSYRERFLIRTAGGIDPRAFPLPILQRPLITDAMVVQDIGAIIPKLPSFEVDNQALGIMMDMKVTNFHIILPPLQTLTNHDQRLLHNT